MPPPSASAAGDEEALERAEERLVGIEDDLDIFRIDGGPTSCAERHRFMRLAIDTSCRGQRSTNSSHMY